MDNKKKKRIDINIREIFTDNFLFYLKSIIFESNYFQLLNKR
jgi:hypothetical protein